MNLTFEPTYLGYGDVGMGCTMRNIVETRNSLSNTIKDTTVEPPNTRHHWDKLLCPLFGGVLYIEVNHPVATCTCTCMYTS